MPDQETSHRFQAATLWEKVGDDRYGEPLRSYPVELTVRWEPVRRLKKDPNGNVLEIVAQAHVDRAVPVGSVMAPYGLADLTGTGSNPQDADEDLYEVVGYDEAADVKGRAVNRWVDLARFRDVLPEQAD